MGFNVATTKPSGAARFGIGHRTFLDPVSISLRTRSRTEIQQMLDVALLSSKPNFPLLVLNRTEAVSSLHDGHRGWARAIISSKEHAAWRGTRAFLNLSAATNLAQWFHALWNKGAVDGRTREARIKAGRSRRTMAKKAS